MVEQHKGSALQEKSHKVQREFVGKVISNKMDKTLVVLVERVYQHPRLKKVIRTSKKYKAHDEQQQAHEGDIVKIREGRPKSKTKYMYLAEVVHAKGKSTAEQAVR